MSTTTKSAAGLLPARAYGARARRSGGFDRRRAGVGGEVVALAREAPHVADPADNLRGQDRSEAVDLGERGGGFPDGLGNTPVELADLALQPPAVAQ